MQKARLETFGIVIATIAAAAGVSQAWTAWKTYQQQEAQQSVPQNSPSLVYVTPSSPVPVVTPSSPAGASLASEVDANYTTLQNLLKARRYKEADKETNRMMLFVARREKQGWLESRAINSFPCQDLRTIDQLWSQNSNGRFGFSIQRQIYNQVGKDWLKWADQVEWKDWDNWKYYDQLIFEMRAPKGHLPVVGYSVVYASSNGRPPQQQVIWMIFSGLHDYLNFLSRIETCKI